MRKFLRQIVPPTLSLLALSAARDASAQTATVDLSTPKQMIRGIGGMSHAAWAGDLTAAERTLAFGNADGQLGFSALRIPVTDGSPDSANVATAKAAIAAGAIVFATPWNSSGAMDSSQFSSYAAHLNAFVSYMQTEGVALYAIGTQNEPDYGTQGGWRSWTAAQCHDFALSYGSTITTKLIGCESYSYNKSYYDPILNDSAALANVAVLGTHLYGTPVSSYSYPLADSKAPGKERWMTEHYTDSTTDANSWPNALGVATELHHAMVDGEFSLYTWWYIVRSYGPIYTDGTVSKRGWCMAQFSKLIRPGFYRVNATASPVSGVYLSGYKNGGEVVVVIVNTNASSQSLAVSIGGATNASYERFTTSASKSYANDGMVAASNGTLSVSLDAESVTTLHAGSGPAFDGGTGSSGSTGGATDGGSSPKADASASGSASGSVDGGPSGVAEGGSGSAGGASTGSVAGGSGASSGGSAGSSGAGSTGAGSTGAGTGATGSTGGTAGSNGTAGESGVASVPEGGTQEPSDGSAGGGCRCGVAHAARPREPLALVGITGGFAVARLRRRSKRSRQAR